jgi:FtsP/CotA-like multicopper oxidase with cupredoxin domain
MKRTDLLKLAGATSLSGAAAWFIGSSRETSVLPTAASASTGAPLNGGRADFTVRIVPTSIEIAPGHTVRTTTYGGVVPGATLRMREGVPVTIDVYNETDATDVIHWHGQNIPPAVDGVIELGTPAVPAHGHQRYRFVPRPRGTRWYHTHMGSGERPDRGGFNGEFGFVIVEPRSDPARYDREVLVALHEWEGRLVTSQGHDPSTAPFLAQPAMGMGMGGGMMGGGMMGSAMQEADYGVCSVNGRALGHGDPIRVRAGERVLFRILNASATLTHRLALPGHRFTVVALDGNPVPSPRTVDAIELGIAERVDAIVEMNAPGVWILGSTDATWRSRGLGTVIEYAGARGPAVWRDPSLLSPWQYASFGGESSEPEIHGRFELVLRQAMGTQNRWFINGRTYPDTTPLAVERGKRYRIAIGNMSLMEHPMHLHGHTFELVSVDGVATSGIRKDTIVVRPMMGQVEIDVVADNPGTFLLHCHNVLHMDGGLMTTLAYRKA